MPFPLPAPSVGAFTSSVSEKSRLGRKAGLALSFATLLLTGGVAAVRGQSALDGFDPNANGNIYAVAVQPDGKILLGGDFTTLSPNGGIAVARNRIARLNPDGTLDTAFNPNANDTVLEIAVQADGKILAGGYFTSIGGQTRIYFARLDPTTGLVDSFNPNGNGVVGSIVVQADGKILVGGIFTSIGGQTRNFIARLDPTTGLADSFNPNANDYVFGITVQADGKIVANGYFTIIGGQTRRHIARLDATTGLADSFNPNAQNGIVWSTAVQTDGKILAVGEFTAIGGQSRHYIARLDATTGQADSFNPDASFIVTSLAVQADGKILAGGQFTNIGGQPRNHLARLDATTGFADSFNPNATGPNVNIFSIAVQPDGKILAGGNFNGVGGQTRNCVARMEKDGRLDQTLNLSALGDFVVATAVQPDGKILIGGSFVNVLGVARQNIARLNTDGTLDAAFNPSPNETVFAIAVQADGKILVGGFFSGANSIGGQSRNHIARLDGVTGLADSFDPNASNAVVAITVQADGKILAGGYFASIGGQSRRYIARIDGTTGLADSFDPNPNVNGYVGSIAVQTDGKILAGGEFTSIGGQPRRFIARLDGATGLADSFNPEASSNLFSIVVQPDGRVLAGGYFAIIGGQPRLGIARLDPVTGLADSFNANLSDFGHVRTIALQADGKILVGGEFTSIGGQPRRRLGRLDPATGLADSFNPKASGIVDSIAVQADGRVLAGGSFLTIGEQRRKIFARLTNDTVAEQDLTVTQNTVTWTRGGSSPQLSRVTFEYSIDNVTFTPLGQGTLAGSSWTLAGLNLPTGQNFYIRARGYYRVNGSQSITESVRNVFFPGPAPTPTPPATPTIPPPTPTPTPPATATPGTPAPTPTPTPTPSLMPAAQAINLSTRMRVQGGDNVGIGGFIVAGTAPKHVLLRAMGPSLAQFGVPNALADPVMELHGPAGFVPIINDNWRDDPVQEPLIIASGIAPANNLESAIDATLIPGAYTAIVRGKNNASGIGLVEVYDLGQAADSKLANISTRAFVFTGDEIVIAGFILGNGSGSDRVVLRGIGPSLSSTGLRDLLPDPTLQLRNSNGALLVANNDWQDNPAQAAELIAAGLAPTHPLESGIAATLPPGLYTALLAGRNDSTGIGLVEVYDRGGESGGPTPSPTPPGTPTPTPSVTPTPTPTASATPPASPTPTATPSGTPTPIPTPPPTCVFSEGFNDITELAGAGWVQMNHSAVVGTSGWFQGNSAVFPAHSGAATSYIAANFNNQGGTNTISNQSVARPLTMQPQTPPSPTIAPTPGAFNTISNWLLTPPLILQNNAVMTFYTRTVDVPRFPDRLQVRMSTNGSSTNVGTASYEVGDFTTLLLDINPTYTTSGYPNVWTQFTVTISGIGSPTTGRLAFRYFVEMAGPNGPNSDYIGIDSALFYCTTPTPTPPPTATPTPSSAPEHANAERSGATAIPTRTPIPGGGADPFKESLDQVITAASVFPAKGLATIGQGAWQPLRPCWRQTGNRRPGSSRRIDGVGWNGSRSLTSRPFTVLLQT
jgi:uncharacterized delta-60 repeat protein